MSHAEAELVRQTFDASNRQLPDTLRTALGDEPAALETSSRMIPLSHLAREIGSGSQVVVRIGFGGDLNGVFLFLQRETDFDGMSAALQATLGGELHTENEATDYLVPDWLRERRAQGVDEGKISDALGELGNALLGGYLTAVYSACEMATFQDLPEVLLHDAQQEWLYEAIEAHRRQADLAFLASVSCQAREQPIRFSLVVITALEGLRAMVASTSA